jgi:hypothetical protein
VDSPKHMPDGIRSLIEAEAAWRETRNIHCKSLINGSGQVQKRR